MALVIKSPQDLKTYLETRRKMAENQGTATRKASATGRISQEEKREDLSHVNGMVYAYNEAIKAVDALIEYQTRMAEEVLEEIRDTITLPFDGDTE